MSSFQPLSHRPNLGKNPVSLEPWKPNDPRQIQRVETALNPTGIPSNYRTFTYVETDSDNRKTHKTASVFFRPQQDVIDTFIFSRNHDGEITIYVLEKLRPVLALRERLSLRPVNKDGRQINLPGFYFKEDGTASGIQGAVNSYVSSFGLEATGSVRTLGPAYFVGSYSPELAFPKIVEVIPEPSNYKQLTRYSDSFEGQVVLHKKSPIEFYNDILSGKINDLRAIQAFFRFCELERIELPSSESLNNPKPGTPLDKVAIPILSKSDIRKRLQQELTTISDVKSLGLTLKSPNLIALNATALNIRNETDNQFDDSYSFEICMFNLPDTVHPIPHFISDNSVYMVLNIRQAVVPILRNQVAHQIYTNDSSHRVEGIFEREPLGINETERLEFIENVLKQRWGLNVTDTPLFQGEGTFSPGFDPEVGRFYTTSIDPTQPLSGDYAEVTCAVNLTDIAGLIESGEIRSLETIAAYEFLKRQYGFTETKELLDPESEILKNELAEIFNQSSPTRKILASQHPEVYAQMMSTHAGQNVIAYIQNEGPGITYAHSSSAIEAGLFDGSNGISPLDSLENKHEEGFLSFHDMMHAIRRDPPAQQLSEEEYTIALLERECDALWFSEVHIPSIYGFDNYKNYCNKTSLGEILIASGFTSIQQQRDAITSMVIDGAIPKDLINHTRYHEIQWCIHEKLIGYYVRDKLENCKLLYNEKMKTPHAGDVLARFYPKNPAQLEHVLEYSHAVNNLKEYTVTLRSEKSSRSISKLAWLAEELSGSNDESDKALLDKTWEIIRTLEKAHDDLHTLSGQIHSSEVNPENIEIYRKIKEIAEGPITEVFDFCERHWHQDREFPAATIHPFFTTEEQMEKIKEIEASQLRNSNNHHLILV